MTANAEARSLLDQLMGVERDAPLPAGAALPRKRGRHTGSGGMVLPGSKRNRSCFDKDVDPLFCAWGVDVYELFVNTKSDIGANPCVPDHAARKEYLGLPPHEKRDMGFEHRLFVKLQELVQVCDRTVNRNHEKLKRELQRVSAKRGGNDYVVDVSAEKVEELVRAEYQLEDTKKDLVEALKELEATRSREEAVLEEQRAEQKKIEDAAAAAAKPEKEEAKEEGDAAAVKEEAAKEEAAKEDEVKKEEEGTDVFPPPRDPAAVKTEEGAGDAGIVIDREGTEEDGAAKDGEEPPKEEPAVAAAAAPPTDPAVLEELGKLTLKKQELLCRIATIVTQIGPLEESIHVMTLKLNFVRSDTTTDKTVCEISGNFMSARDADERIAAHYAGKQYVGWKLVRDKFREMVQQHGRHGPPRPSGRGPGGPPLQSYRGGGGGGRGDRHGGGGGGYRGRDDRGRGRYGGGGGGGDGRWERGGGYGDHRRHDDRRRYGGGGYGGGGGGGDRGRYGGGGGGYGRR